MFSGNFGRPLSASVTLSLLTGLAHAGPLADQASASAKTPDSADVRVLSTHDYVQTELDWRSYYLNRQPGRIGVLMPDRSAQTGSGWMRPPSADGS